MRSRDVRVWGSDGERIFFVWENVHSSVAVAFIDDIDRYTSQWYPAFPAGLTGLGVYTFTVREHGATGVDMVNNVGHFRC